ncbi:hypothetical protein LA04_13125 [Enterobacter sp. UCD-UG_FMILLET]|nr:hypothetical protein LA04_13125 [Enterobacter sp. UCD-UG_FMILLET]
MTNINLPVEREKILDTQRHHHNTIKCPGVGFKAPTNGDDPFTIGSADYGLANKNLLIFIFLVVDKKLSVRAFAWPRKTFLQRGEDIALRIVNNHVINLGKQIVLIIYHSLNMVRLLRRHAINFDYVGNGSN